MMKPLPDGPPCPPRLAAEIVAEMADLQRFARHLLGGAAAADDLVQDTLVRALRKHRHYETGTNLRAWLFVIMRNIRIDQARQARKRRLEPFEEAAACATPPTQERTVAVNEVLRRIARAPAKQRRLLQASALGDSYEVIAADEGIPLGTVRSRLCRARQQLMLELME